MRTFLFVLQVLMCIVDCPMSCRANDLTFFFIDLPISSCRPLMMVIFMFLVVVLIQIYLYKQLVFRTVKMWSVPTGECIKTFPHRGPVRGVHWAEDNRRFATVSDPFVEHNAKISIFDISVHQHQQKEEEVLPILEIDIPKEGPGGSKRVNATNITWTCLNEYLFVTFDNGMARLYHPETGEMVQQIRLHDKKINRVQFNKDKTLFITSSADFTSKLYDAVYMSHLKTYKTDRPVNDAVISEHKDHILLGGGQEAMSVTTTAGKVGKFETRFFHLVYEEEFGSVKGHFGPINALAINPNGLNYASGAEDGYVRLHHFDKSYLDMEDPVPEADEVLEGDADLEETKQ